MTMQVSKRTLIAAAAIAGLTLAAFQLNGAATASTPGGVVYFAVTNGGKAETFVIALSDPAAIAHARAIIAGTEHARTHVAGKVAAGTEPYNAVWHFHLEPSSITFFENAIEVCDAATSYVDAHLSEVGGSFLPNSHWCPWNSRVSAELTKQVGH
jgi:hypothetical protein